MFRPGHCGICENGYPGISDLLAGKYFSSPYATTRVSAMKLLARLRGNFVKVTGAALNDSYGEPNGREMPQSGDPGWPRH
ncbi:MAG: hypothetical protein R2758_12330 [Bacteroidales bacterium]